MSAYPLLEMAERRVLRPASLEAFDHLLPTLAKRELEVLHALCRYVEVGGHENATGGELARWAGLSLLQVRPRLTGLAQKGLVLSGAMRASRCPGELRCHPVWPTVSLAAVERALAASRA